MDVCADALPGVEIYWGVSPVVQASSRRYWEVKNRAFFPASFEPTLEWNRRFAADCLRWAREREERLYFMPIRVPLDTYLTGLL
jgi:methylenetetrahydrofolate reductase (NADPH)